MLDVVEGIGTNFYIVEVGSDDRPASQEDVDDVENTLRQVVADKGDFYGVVAHHAIEVSALELPPREVRPIVIFKYGTDARPATDEDLTSLQQRIASITADFPFLVVGNRLAINFVYPTPPRHWGYRGLG